MVFLELRWNYSPLKEKAVQLPDGLFVSSGRFAATARELCSYWFLCPWCTLLGTPDSLMAIEPCDKICHKQKFCSGKSKTLPLLNTDNTGKTEVVCNS